MVDCTVVVVSYNTRDLLRDCLTALSRFESPSAVIVVDNESSDGSADMVEVEFPAALVVRTGANLGFAAGTNVGLRLARTPFVCLLNPDTRLLNPAISLMVADLQAHPEVAAAGPQLVNPDGSLQHSAFAFPGLAQAALELFTFRGSHRLANSWINGRYPLGQTRPYEIDTPLGACIVARRTAIDAIGLLDESFFMYCEEIDWAWRLKRAGWRIVSVPEARVVHVGGASTGQFREAMFVELYRSRLKLYDRYHGSAIRQLYRAILRAGLTRTASDPVRREAANRILAEA